MLVGVVWAARYESLTVRNLKVRLIEPWAQKYGLISGNSFELTNSSVGLATPLNNKEAEMAWAAGTGFTMAAGGGSLFTFDVTAVTNSNETNADIGIANAGVTIEVDTPTAANHLEQWTFKKNDSGTTKVIFYCGGLPIDTASGTTNTNFDLDAEADIVTLMPNFNGGVSIIVVSKNIH
jgi:hypothetical protein